MTTDFTRFPDLAMERLGGEALLTSDDFFAPMCSLLKPGRGVFDLDRYTDRGKWMDGWESRRRRDDGYDWCIIKLAAVGQIHGVIVDTNHFRGNHPSHCSIDACLPPQSTVPDPLEFLRDPSAPWQEVVPRTALDGHTEHLLPVQNAHLFRYVRLNIFPDGGVARFRVHGRAHPDWATLGHDGPIDLASALHGGIAEECSDMFFSAPGNLLLPTPALHMGDGWETRRRRGPGHDWCIIRLGCAGIIEAIEVDTTFFKGNFPARCSLDLGRAEAEGDAPTFQAGISEAPLTADSTHRFELNADLASPCTHVRLNIFPDGGISRIRVLGRPCMVS